MAFIPKTFSQILKTAVDYFVGQRTGVTDVNVGSVARSILEAAAVEEERIYIQTTEGLLDAIDTSAYNSFGFGLLAATASYGELTLTRSGGYSPDITIAPNQQFSVLDTAKVYSPTTTTLWTGGSGSTTKTIQVQCKNVGAIGNTPAGTITNIVTPITGVASATNAKAFITGADEETVDQRRSRFSSYIYSLPRATQAAIEYGARTSKLVDAGGYITERTVRSKAVESTGPTQYAFTSTAVLSPASVAANTTAEQTLAFAGTLTTDVVVRINKPTAQAGLGIVGVRIPSNGNVAITFSNHTAGAIVPTASETYTLIVLRSTTANLHPVSLKASLTPVSVGANTTAEQTITFAGLLTTDTLIGISKPSQQAGLGIVGARIPSNNNVAITFSNNTSGSVTPTSGETYTVTVLRATSPQILTSLTASLTPSAVAADTTVEQILAFTGVLTGDVAVSLIKPTAQAGLGIANVRIYGKSTNWIGITFVNNTGSPITPTASENYVLTVARTGAVGSGNVYIYNGVGTPGGTPTSETLVTNCQTVIDGTATVAGYRAAGIVVTASAATEIDTTIKAIVTDTLPGYTIDLVRANCVAALSDLISRLDIGETLFKSTIHRVINNVPGVRNSVIVAPANDTTITTAQVIVSSAVQVSRFTTSNTTFMVNIV